VLNEAAPSGHLEVVRVLLAAGVNPDGVMDEKALLQALERATKLYEAASSGHVDAVEKAPRRQRQSEREKG
jgi:ankyrin repeat protein